MSWDAQPPARLVRRGGGVLGEPAARTRYAHPNAHDSDEASGEAAAPSATSWKACQPTAEGQQIAENDDAVHGPVRTSSFCAAQAIDRPDERHVC
jgi:hypothetical protein